MEAPSIRGLVLGLFGASLDGWLAGRLAGWLAGWLACWLVGWFAAPRKARERPGRGLVGAGEGPGRGRGEAGPAEGPGRDRELKSSNLLAFLHGRAQSYVKRDSLTVKRCGGLAFDVQRGDWCTGVFGGSRW